MLTLEDQIEESRREALAALAAVDSGGALEEWSAKYLGKKGEMTGLFRGVGALPAKQELEEAYAQAKERIVSEERDKRLQAEAVDVSLPGRPLHAGHLHIITQTSRDILRAFRDMGFQVYEGPDVELDKYDFELLNIPPEHPARSMQDTFYVDDRLLGTPPPGESMDG